MLLFSWLADLRKTQIPPSGEVCLTARILPLHSMQFLSELYHKVGTQEPQHQAQKDAVASEGLLEMHKTHPEGG